MTKTYKTKLNTSQNIQLQKFLSGFEKSSNNIYIKKFYKFNDAAISIYTNDTLLIQANNPEDIYKQIFNVDVTTKSQIIKPLISNSRDIQNTTNTIGSDEVGVGDFYGGLVVAAVFVKPDDINWLKSIGVKDSKLLTDSEMYQIFNILKERVLYSCKEFSPCEYNKEYEKYNNSHILKAILHNDAICEIQNTVKENFITIMDEFASEKNYYSYLQKANMKACKIDIFMRKAESHFIAVACASIIARVYFLEQIKKLEKQYNVKLLLGASNPRIKIIGRNIIKNKSQNELKMLSKYHFRTFKEIVGG
ncbi:MAG: ribonuclease HIII [Mycoplasma sp.]